MIQVCEILRKAFLLKPMPSDNHDIIRFREDIAQVDHGSDLSADTGSDDSISDLSRYGYADANMV